MKRSVSSYIWLTVATSIAVFALLVWADPSVHSADLRAVLTLSVIAVVSHVMGHDVSREARGSVSFVPYLASAAISPTWTAVVGVLCVSLIVQVVRRRSFAKSAFNLAQHTLSVSVAILAYRLLGGSSLLSRASLPYIAFVGLLVAYSAINTTAVSGIIALNDGRRMRDVWTKTCLGTIKYTVIALPLIVGLAWIYVRFGAPGAFVVAMALFGLEELYKINSQLERANQELLELMVAAIEARDPYTSGHSRRVSEHAKLIAEIVGLRGSEVRRVQITGLLHDVGKIHEIFAPILQKPGRLTDAENAVMQTHPIKSEELVAKVSQLRDLVPAVRHHHENWDGTGYPDGLAGDRIPLASRIVMFADTIDAMTSDRPYRRALDPSSVRAELMKHRGRQFDPTICDTLLSSSRFEELFKHAGHQSLPHTQEVPQLRLASQG